MKDPLILAIECSDQQGSFALLRGERVLAHSSESLGKKLGLSKVRTYVQPAAARTDPASRTCMK